MSENFSQVIHSRIWFEEPETNNPFVASACRCHGYDVYGDLLGKASYIEYLYLLFKGDRPASDASKALEVLAVALANPGPRDPSVHAAMAAGVGGSPASSSLMAALAAGAGSYGGARDVLLAMEDWSKCGTDMSLWKTVLTSPREQTRPLFWPQSEHSPGFDSHGVTCSTPVRQSLAHLSALLPCGQVAWLSKNRNELEVLAERPLAMSGVAAATFINLGFSAAEGEMLTLLLRLPGAAAHALEQKQRGFRQFPFFSLDLQNDPGPVSNKEEV